uniref:Platelet activating factor acetylhydrolase 1b catalytic subunit 3 n=1 Tax=Hucho hucho TaxID=62062 RepID=A0A4W5QE96_9TELE
QACWTGTHFNSMKIYNCTMGRPCVVLMCLYQMWVGGDLAHISPTVVVLWVGTHNHGHTAEQICGGIMAIVQLIKDNLLCYHVCFQPQGVLPRGKMPNPLRERNAKVNKLVQEAVSSLPHASLLNVDPGFVHSDGSISHQDLYDYLHLTPQVYQAVCRPLHAHLKGLLEKQAEN